MFAINSMKPDLTFQLIQFRMLAVIVLLAAVAAGCEDNEIFFTAEGFEQSTCISCHMDKELLKEVADPIEQKESSGEG